MGILQPGGKPGFILLILFMVLTGCREASPWQINQLSNRLESEARIALQMWGEQESEYGPNAIITLGTLPGTTRGVSLPFSLIPRVPSWVIVINEKRIDAGRINCPDRGVWVIAHEIGHYHGYGHSSDPGKLMLSPSPCGGSRP